MKVRKNAIIRRFVSLLLLVTVLAALFSGCGSRKQEDDQVTTIVIGSGNSYEPYCYLDADGNPAGYEYAVLAAIDEILPQYEFEYQAIDFSNLLLSLDTGKVDLAAHQFEYTEDRAANYLFAEEPYTTYITYIGVLTGNTDINSLDDLQGKTVYSRGARGADVAILQAYNDEHPENPINIYIVENASYDEEVAALQSGVVDAITAPKRDVEKMNAAYGNGQDIIKIVGDPVNNSKTYYLYQKDNTELREAIDGALRQLREDGTLSALSIEYLGADYTESE